MIFPFWAQQFLPLGTAHSASWTAQTWLDCTVRICPELGTTR